MAIPSNLSQTRGYSGRQETYELQLPPSPPPRPSRFRVLDRCLCGVLDCDIAMRKHGKGGPIGIKFSLIIDQGKFRKIVTYSCIAVAEFVTSETLAH